jgi:hypothetical protein
MENIELKHPLHLYLLYWVPYQHVGHQRVYTFILAQMKYDLSPMLKCEAETALLG